MTDRVQVGSLQVAKVLHDFINERAIPGTGVDAASFWSGVEALIKDLAPKNKALLAKRDDFQAQIDAWHQARAGQAHNAAEYKAFLQEIGYLLPEPADFQATTQNVDEEIATMAGPQLVVPVMNARFALNAANARWGSLYDALYGTDAISEEGGATKGPGYNEIRGNKVIAFARAFLDQAAPAGQWFPRRLHQLHHQGRPAERCPERRQHHRPERRRPVHRLSGRPLRHRLACCSSTTVCTFEIQIDPTSNIGQTDAAGVKDVLMESALTTIMDCEDSVAAVDADDKTVVYANWPWP